MFSPISSRLAAVSLAAMFLLAACGGNDSTTDDTGGSGARCLPEAVDCDDTPGADEPGVDSAADCETGVDCDDTSGEAAGTRPADGEAPSTMGMCAPDTPDCNDMVVVGEDAVAGDEPLMAADIHRVDELSPDTRVVEMAPGSMADPFPIFLQEAVVDGTQVTVTFSGGEAPCFAVDHADVAESDDQVVVTVYVGQPDPDAQDCDQQEISSQAVTVELSQELGARALLDGSRIAPQDAQS